MTNAMRVLKTLHELGVTEGPGNWVTKKELSKAFGARDIPNAFFAYSDRFALTMWAALVDGLVSIKRENRRLLLRLTPLGELAVMNHCKTLKEI